MADFCFMLSHFESLPKSYADYKTLVYGLFPQIFDTKMLTMREPFKFVPEAASPYCTPPARVGIRDAF